MMTVRGEPDYVDQVPRRMAYEETHPKTEIIYIGPHWQAVLREDAGQRIITRHSLKQQLTGTSWKPSMRRSPERPRG